LKIPKIWIWINFLLNEKRGGMLGESPYIEYNIINSIS